MKLILSIALLMLFCNHSFAQEEGWISVGSGQSTGEVFMRTTMVNKDEYGIQVWTKQTIKKFKVGSVFYANVLIKTLYCFNCYDKKMQTRASIAYSANGKIIAKYNREEYEYTLDYENVIPDSVGEQLLEKACELFN